MPYIDREFGHVGDTARVAAEILARGVERFLDPEAPAPFYANVDYLSWELKRFDLCKAGSGQDFHNWNYEVPAEPVEAPVDEEGEA